MSTPTRQGTPPPSVLNAMFRHTRMAMIATDPHRDDNPIVYANEAFLNLTGYDLGEVIGRNCRFLQGEGTDPAAVDAIRAAIAEERFGYIEILNYRKDGTPFWNALHVSPVRDEEGRLTHFFGSQWDVTDQRNAIETIEGDARVSAERMQEATGRARQLEFAVNQANDSMLMTEWGPLDEPGPKITWVSRGFERMTGYKSSEVIGRSPRLLQGERTERAVLDRLRTGLEAGESIASNRTVNYRKDGTPFWIEWSVSPVTDKNGDPSGWLAVQRDVTEAVAAEEERERLLLELDHRVRNLFSTVQVLVRSADDGDGSAEALRQRLLYQLGALSSAHELVFRDPARHAPMADIVEAVLAPFDPDGSLIARDGGEGSFEGKQAVDAAIILYELARLSSERGALGSGRAVSLAWHEEDAEMRITWSEESAAPGDDRVGWGLVNTFMRSSRWPEAGIDEEEGHFTVRLGLRAV